MNYLESWHDPIVEEIHAIRKDLAKRFNGSLKDYSDSATAHCIALGFVPLSTFAQQDSPRDNPKAALLSCP